MIILTTLITCRFRALGISIGPFKASDSSRQNKELDNLWGQLESGKGGVSLGKKRDLKGRELAGDGAYHTLDTQLEELQVRARRQSEIIAEKFGRGGTPSGMQQIEEGDTDSDSSDEGMVVQRLPPPGSEPASARSEPAEDKKIKVLQCTLYNMLSNAIYGRLSRVSLALFRRADLFRSHCRSGHRSFSKRKKRHTRSSLRTSSG